MTFAFAAHAQFRNRTTDLERLEDWWTGDERNALAVYGRRRVGKSWLLREFAHGKPAVFLVADRRALAPQLDRFADLLAPHLGVRPAIRSLGELVRALHRLGAGEPALVVIDEFPYLLPTRERDRAEILTEIQAALEERDASRLKLMLCGSYVGQMERLLSGPLRGRLTPLVVDPLSFAESRHFMDDATGPQEHIERFSVAGGMSLYLDELGRGGSLRDRICDRVLPPRAPLFNDPREVLEEELRAPGIYYSLLEELAGGRRSLSDLANAIGRPTTDLQRYLDTLREMRLVRRVVSITATNDTRGHRYELHDPFMRFWFRFVFPFQEELRGGLDPRVLHDTEIAPAMSDHVSPSFEALCRRWVARTGGATRVGPWWGRSLDALRRDGSRQTEEIDVVGMSRSAVTVLGECKWTSRPMGADVLEALESFKIPALRQAGTGIARDARIVLFSRSGFSPSLDRIAATRDDVVLCDPARLVTDLIG